MINDIIVVEDFLHKVTQHQIETLILQNKDIKWCYRHSPSYKRSFIDAKFKHNDNDIFDKEFGDFSHQLLIDDTRSEVYDLFPDFKKLIETKFKIKVKHIKRININFAFPTGVSTTRHDTPHCDLLEGKNCKSIVCYINDSDGDTVFFDEFSNGTIDASKKTIINRIAPKAGRAVLFDSTRYHSGSFPSKKIRIIINIVLTIENE